MTAGLARVTISAPQRRVDVALPERVPLAELLPDVLRHAGVDLADQGENHGGWVLRRADGVALATGQGLQTQGVRDGEVLHLVPAHEEWPEAEYDDVVEAVAEGARRRGGIWTPATTRTATLAAAGVPLGLGLLALFAAGPGVSGVGSAGLGAAALLLLAGTIAARGHGQTSAGVALGGYALPYAFLGGAASAFAGGGPAVGGGSAAGGTGSATRWDLLTGSVAGWDPLAGSLALLVAGVLGTFAITAGVRIFAAGVTAGLLGALTALLGALASPGAAAAALISVLICGLGALPVLAVRLGRMPLPPLALPARGPGRPESETAEPPDRVAVFAAVDRTDEILIGLLLGHALLALVAFVLLALEGSLSARILIGVCATALLLRARLFVTGRLRIPLLVAGLGGFAALGADLLLTEAWDKTLLPGLIGSVLLIGTLTVTAGARYVHRPPSPYLSRAADLLEGLTVIAVIPVACAVAGLYTALSGLP
ncbi:type VII secretion integral membrane protein EccD [Actinoplanes lutulentus]|uniref:Type VII secretion integral membrane protein EccD n=1 Tax=Actinoplanes lutulentus TaxID=1287878 RepID=A0A327YZM3_9ACTN|nr:type VII secretion integral membrane protein EccD [Actinoplanes lutulentus]MBB2945684.1 type VII secretion integral membrane protein EccD [Actinoplanes lutulentus]RAK27281.1 type VII secretion integral membrane protein EccD [Actinoplanes lutulentus]